MAVELFEFRGTDVENAKELIEHSDITARNFKGMLLT